MKNIAIDMRILGWDANLTGYTFTAILLGVSIGIFISNLRLFNLVVALILLLISFFLSLYFWHVKKVKDVFMKSK